MKSLFASRRYNNNNTPPTPTSTNFCSDSYGQGRSIQARQQSGWYEAGCVEYRQRGCFAIREAGCEHGSSMQRNASMQASKEAILTGLTHTGLLRLQPSQVRTRCRQRRLGPGRMQSIFPHRRPTTFTKSHRRCLLALVRQTTRPDERSHHHHGCQ